MTYFDARYQDLIGLVIGGVPSFVNVRKAKTRGVEAAVRVRPWAWVTLSGTYTWPILKAAQPVPRLEE